MAESPDYEALIAAWVEERDALELMIEWAKKKLGKGATDSTGNADPKSVIRVYNPMRPTFSVHGVQSDTFFRMSVPQAIKTYLNIAKRPQSAKAITEALQNGGLTTRAKNLYGTVFPTLQRMKKAGEVDKVTNGEWGLAEWYRSERRESQPSSEEPE